MRSILCSVVFVPLGSAALAAGSISPTIALPLAAIVGGHDPALATHDKATLSALLDGKTPPSSSGPARSRAELERGPSRDGRRTNSTRRSTKPARKAKAPRARTSQVCRICAAPSVRLSCSRTAVLAPAARSDRANSFVDAEGHDPIGLEVAFAGDRTRADPRR